MSRCYWQLTHSDLRRRYHPKERTLSIIEVARQFGRHSSMIYRELNGYDREFPEYGGYFSMIADDIRSVASACISSDGIHISADCRISQWRNFIGKFGNLEGDLLVFTRELGHPNITSLVERKSQYTMVVGTRALSWTRSLMPSRPCCRQARSVIAGRIRQRQYKRRIVGRCARERKRGPLAGIFSNDSDLQCSTTPLRDRLFVVFDGQTCRRRHARTEGILE